MYVYFSCWELEGGGEFGGGGGELHYEMWTHWLAQQDYASMIYTALNVMFLMRADPLRGQVGGGWAQEIETFWALWNGI